MGVDLSMEERMPTTKLLPDMTLEELKAEYAFWDLKVRSAAQWGSAMAFAESQRVKIEEEIARRRKG